MNKKRVVIVGAGTGGLSVLRNLRRKRSDIELTIIEPNQTHYYQPLWTLIGAGILPFSKSAKNMADFIPKDVNWIKDFVTKFDPENNTLITKDGTQVSYDFLVVAPGIQLDWKKIEGLEETLGKNGVCSNYSEENVEYTWKTMNSLKDGSALFTFPNTPIKCAGAPQKIMYLAEETFRNNSVRDQIKVEFVSAGGAIFGIEKYKKALQKVIKKRDIKEDYKLNLIAIDGHKKIATFENIETHEKVVKSFNMIHVSPPMSAPDFIKNSPISNESGWVDVDKYSTQHNKFKNIFSIGDASSMPNSKTGAAIRKQGPVLVANLLAELDGKAVKSKYDGYASCPLVTSRSTCILAEFDYSGKPAETFPFNQAKERRSMYILKKIIIPFMYWKAMMKGYF
jgi:sulfide:quinone oxidoreductase